MAGIIRAFDACDGKLSYSEQRAAPAVLAEAFRIIDYARGVRRSVEMEDAKRETQRKG